MPKKGVVPPHLAQYLFKKGAAPQKKGAPAPQKNGATPPSGKKA